MKTPTSTTLFRLIGEPAPVIRSSDLLTEDHPLRPYPAVHPARYSAWLRALAFSAVFAAVFLLWTSMVYLAAGTVALIAMPLAELASAVIAYSVLVFYMESRTPAYEIEARRLTGLLKGMVLGAVLLSLCIGILALVGSYSITVINWHYSPWIALLVTGVVAGVSEEILLRGALFRLVEEGLGTWGAVVVSALVFGGIHLSNPEVTVWGMVAIAVEAGILFAAVYTVTRSLWWCIGLHFAWNMMEGPVFGSIVSGSGAQDSWLIASWTGPDILTGGTFGLEGSIVPVILLGLAGIGLLVYAARKHLIVSPIWVRRSHLTRLLGSTTQPQSGLY